MVCTCIFSFNGFPECYVFLSLSVFVSWTQHSGSHNMPRNGLFGLFMISGRCLAVNDTTSRPSQRLPAQAAFEAHVACLQPDVTMVPAAMEPVFRNKTKYDKRYFCKLRCKYGLRGRWWRGYGAHVLRGWGRGYWRM